MFTGVILDGMGSRKIFNGYYALRWKILERDNFTCLTCGQKAPNVKLEVDHIVPVYEGGTDEEVNLRTLCYACNRGRNSLSIISRHRKKCGEYSLPKVVLQIDRQGEALGCMLSYPNGITNRELAQAMNIRARYANVLLHRLYHSGRIEKLKQGVYILKGYRSVLVGEATE
jgi:hypothetical protein